MKEKLDILSYRYLKEFEAALKGITVDIDTSGRDPEMAVDKFDFYNSVSCVYSSKIEGEDIDFDSYYKHKFLNVKYREDYTKKADDLFEAYRFIKSRKITLPNLKKAHSILSANLLSDPHRGKVRNNIMMVLNTEGMIEYVAADPKTVRSELEKLFRDIEVLTQADLNIREVFYFASQIHLVLVKIHPFQDGNGRTARLLEKWFLIKKIGDAAHSVQLEKNYYSNLNNYYSNLKKLGLEYETLDYSKSLDFLLMTVKSLNSHRENKDK